MKKVLAIFVVACLVLSLFTGVFTAVPSARAETEGDYTYTIDGGSNVTITGYTGAGGAIIIPSSLGGNPVTAIGDIAFYGLTTLTSMDIPDGVASIGAQAFRSCINLISVTIGNSVTSIGNGAFDSCSSLTSVTIPASVTSIGSNAFSNCTSLASLTIGSGVTSIGGYAFQNCLVLTSVTIPSGVTSIVYGTFQGCLALISVTIPNSVTAIGADAFAECSALSSVTIPDNVTSISYRAFNGCSSLTSVTIPASVASVGLNAFKGCAKLADAYFLGNAPTGTTDMFAGCATGFTVNYVNTTTGWTNPWYGYPTATTGPTTYAVAFHMSAGSGNIGATVDGVAITTGDLIVAGKTVVFTATPGIGYQVSNWNLNGTVVEGNVTNTLTVSNLAATTAVIVQFEAIPASIPVVSITVTGAGGATSVVSGGTLAMSASVLPSDATDPSVTWSWTTLSGNASASIGAPTGVLTGGDIGTITVIATANDGSGVTGTEVITVNAVTHYGIWVGGTEITSLNAANISGTGISAGTVTYDAVNNVLTLNNAQITGYYSDTWSNGAGIYAATVDLKITLIGSSTINITLPFRGAGIMNQGKGVTLNGTGSLAIALGGSPSQFAMGIWSTTASYINGGTVTVTGGNTTGTSNALSSGIYVASGRLSIENATVTANGGTTTGSNASYGISASGMTVVNSTVTTTGNTQAISVGGSILLNGSSIVAGAATDGTGAGSVSDLTGQAGYKYVKISAPLPVATVTFATAGPIAKFTTDAAFTNVATGNGTGAIAYSSGNTATATVGASGDVTILAAGSTVITATQAADATYAAGTATYTLNVIAPTDLNAYNTALTAVIETDYTTASWTTYQGVVTANVVTTANTQTQVNTATGRILVAQNSLVTIAAGDLIAAQMSADTALTAAFTTYIEDNYTAANWTTLTGFDTDGITAIGLAADTDEVDAALLAATDGMDAVETIAETLDAAKVTALADLATAFGDYTEGDYTAANWTTLTGFKTAGDMEIDAATTTEAVTSAQITATVGMEGVATIAGDLAIAKAAVPADLTGYTEATALAVTNAEALPETTTLNKTDKTTAINIAIAALVLKADLTTYNAALAAVIEIDYTTTSWTIYKGVVTTNAVTTSNTQTQVNVATSAITTAQTDLVIASPVVPITYAVTFDSQGGSGVAAITDITAGTTITLPTAPTKTGSTFNGWFTAITEGKGFTTATPVTAGVTVYAQWTATYIPATTQEEVFVSTPVLAPEPVFVPVPVFVPTPEPVKKPLVLVFQIGKPMFWDNSIPTKLDSSPVIRNSRTLLPIRAIIEALEGTVSWDATTKKITVTLGGRIGGKTLVLWIGKSVATVNGVSIPIDATDVRVVPEILNGRTMLPLRFIAENLGATVGWDQETQTTTITYTP